MSNQSILTIIAFCLKAIQEKGDWRPFDDLVLNHFCHDSQYRWLSNSTARENVLHPGNGWGKTDVIAKKHIRYILQHFLDGPKYKTLNVAITSEQSELVQDRIIEFVRDSPLLNQLGFLDNRHIVKFPFPRLTYCNGASTEFKTTKRKGESIEGKEYGYISADEIALETHLEFIRDKILLPRIRRWKDSQLDFSATPKGLNAFYRVKTDIARKGGHVQGGTSYENPHIDHALLDYQCSTWSQAKINQIIRGEFIDTAEMMFASRIEKLFNSDLSLSDGVDVGGKYIEGWDLARGRKGSISDQTVGYRIRSNTNPCVIVKRWGFQLPWTEKGRENINQQENTKKENSSIEREIRLANYESKSKVLVDSTGVGDTLWEMLMDIAQPIDFRGGRKDVLLDHLQAVIDCGALTSPYIPELADQMTTYQRDDTNLETDDIMALAISASLIPVHKSHFGTIVG